MALSKEAAHQIETGLQRLIEQQERVADMWPDKPWLPEAAAELRRILDGWRAGQDRRRRLTLSGVVIGPSRTVQVSGVGELDGRYRVVKRMIGSVVVEREDEVR